MADDLNRRNMQFINTLVESGILRSDRVIGAFKRVPRHLFVPLEEAAHAYEDIALPITLDSTISQPSTVAMMLELLDVRPYDRVLEIGTGSGWNAALMGEIAGPGGHVTTLEISGQVADFARVNIGKLPIRNVTVICEDGSGGHAAGAPYDRIVYTAAVSRIPDAVMAQLKAGGRLLAPVGDGLEQTLSLFEKNQAGGVTKTDYGSFQFVPLRSAQV